jgi:hypothetical protein
MTSFRFDGARFSNPFAGCIAAIVWVASIVAQAQFVAALHFLEVDVAASTGLRSVQTRV